MARQQPGLLLAIALGGAAGGPARAAITLALPVHADKFPWAIFLINVSGAFLIGVLLPALRVVRRGTVYVRSLLVTGFCGGFTTWSTFMVGADQLVARGHLWIALAHLGLSVAAGLVAVTVGWYATHHLLRRPTSGLV